MKRISYLTFILLLTIVVTQAQNSEYKLQNYHPASPAAFEFLKYTEMPVSEYTGIPNISIPLYQIEEDGVTIPLNLTYHAGGIRVNQEASWVGLGWDLSIGSIMQEINDVDDYSTCVKLLPDWNTSPIPQLFPMRYQYSCAPIPTPGYSTTVPINSPQPAHSYMISTAYYVPINGNADNQPLGQALFTYPEYDSEPDIFQANFLGHSLTFMRDFTSGNILVLNKRGYVVTRTGNSFKIIVPSGDEYYFEVNSETQSYSSSSIGLQYASSATLLPSSKMFMLTKIITKNKKEILFNYTQTSIFDNYPNYSEKWDKLTSQASYAYLRGDVSQVLGYSGLALGSMTKTFSYSKDSKLILSSINFPKGNIVFTTSNRNDMLGSQKLDAIQINSYTNQGIKSFQFNYSYFDASGVNGNTSEPPHNAALFGNMPNLRLKLSSIQDNSGAMHTFNYNTSLLPSKNSLAQDYWGFYNGQLGNGSLIPNPARLNIAGLTDNGNNNSANLSFAQSGILNEITYPTGGKVGFEYELNQFDNYWVPDLSTSTNTISSGNGIRIHTINFKKSDNSSATKTVYTYSGGKHIVPVEMWRHYNLNSIYLNGTTLNNTVYVIDELNGKGFFSTNALGSLNGVGYDKVIKQEVDANGIPNGRTETIFNNTPDIISNTVGGTSQIAAALPAIKKERCSGKWHCKNCYNL